MWRQCRRDQLQVTCLATRVTNSIYNSERAPMRMGVTMTQA